MRDRGVNELDVLTGFNNNEGGLLGFLQVLSGGTFQETAMPAAFKVLLQNAVDVSTRNQANEAVEKVIQIPRLRAW